MIIGLPKPSVPEVSQMRNNDCIQACGRTINYEIVYSKRRKRAAIVVHPDLKVEFRAPAGLSAVKIREMVREKAGWVLEKLGYFEENGFSCRARRYVSGENYLYLGKEYSLQVVCSQGKKSAGITGQNLVVTVPRDTSEELYQALVKDILWQWYRERAKETVGGFVEVYSEKLGIPSPLFRIKYQKRRWGSCSADNILRINLQLLMAPPAQVEYVVVHELCHVKEKNHSLSFWQLVESVLPGYRAEKEALRKDGWKYVL